MEWRCTNCGGTYTDVDRSGVSYYHACPEGRVLVAGVFAPFPARDRRDENIESSPTIKAEGKGRVRLIARPIDSSPTGGRNSVEPDR